MGKNSNIEWTHHTFNPWRGCQKVSAGCHHCYAESQAKRNPKVLGIWGADGTRVVARDAMWAEPIKWNKEAIAAGERHRVFCASMADVFEDRPELVEPRRRLARLIWATQNLDWLLLTKRPENAERMIYDMFFNDGEWPKNIWLGASVEDQANLEIRLPALLEVPVAVRFLSVEPMIGPVDLINVQCPLGDFWNMQLFDTNEGIADHLHWVIIGGESGSEARACHVQWVRRLLQQCQESGVACFVKQLGSNVNIKPSHVIEWKNGWQSSGGDKPPRPLLNDKKGGDIDEWPEYLRVRQFPHTPAQSAESI